MKRVMLWFLLLCLPMTLSAAINPDHFVNVASDHLVLRETGRVVHEWNQGEARLRRVTLVAVVVDDRSAGRQKVGSTIVIDYTVDLTERARAAKAHADRMGTMPGPQFLGEPDPPVLGESRTYLAHLAPSGQRLGNVNRHAGAVQLTEGYAATGEVYVPVAGPYSFETD
ncbi:hypothetical protein [Arenimonas sp. MALMAid1274]|uniref:hypothetical protein n=1 Tax=Arenimonas sp. MALMAid1274 TaxID=3411630 RepID=UPI003BA13EAD